MTQMGGILGKSQQRLGLVSLLGLVATRKGGRDDPERRYIARGTRKTFIKWALQAIASVLRYFFAICLHLLISIVNLNKVAEVTASSSPVCLKTPPRSFVPTMLRLAQAIPFERCRLKK
jgi:hypothetical protein